MRLRRFLDGLLGVVLTPLILFEEWGWEPLRKLAAWVASSWPLAWLSRAIARLPPYGALTVMAIPSMTLIPVKLLAVWLIAHGFFGLSVALLVVSKLLGTALLAQLFSLTQPALMRIAWFASGYARWMVWKTDLLTRLKATVPWRAAHRVSERVRAAWQRRAGP